jgi:hypothetical protein
MEEMFTRFFDDLAGRLDGPMTFRFVLQPVMAAIAAIRSGLKDAKTGKPPYFWALFTDPGHRADMLKDGWKSVGRIYILGIAMDVVYQILVFRRFYPLEMLVVAAVLAIVPYLLIRGPVTRILRGKYRKTIE